MVPSPFEANPGDISLLETSWFFGSLFSSVPCLAPSLLQIPWEDSKLVSFALETFVEEPLDS